MTPWQNSPTAPTSHPRVKLQPILPLPYLLLTLPWSEWATVRAHHPLPNSSLNPTSFPRKQEEKQKSHQQSPGNLEPGHDSWASIRVLVNSLKLLPTYYSMHISRPQPQTGWWWWWYPSLLPKLWWCMILQLLTSNIHIPIHMMSSITLPEFLFYSNTIARLTAQKLQQENKRQNKTKQKTKWNKGTRTNGYEICSGAVSDFSPPNCGSPENRAQTTGASDNRVRLRCLLRCESLFHLYSIDCTLVLTLGRQNLRQSMCTLTDCHALMLRLMMMMSIVTTRFTSLIAHQIRAFTRDAKIVERITLTHHIVYFWPPPPPSSHHQHRHLLSCLAWLNALLQHPHHYTVYGPLLMSLSYVNIKILKFCCKFPNVFGVWNRRNSSQICCMNWSFLRLQRKRKTLGVDSSIAPRTN